MSEIEEHIRHKWDNRNKYALPDVDITDNDICFAIVDLYDRVNSQDERLRTLESRVSTMERILDIEE